MTQHALEDLTDLYTQLEDYFYKGISQDVLQLDKGITAYKGLTHLNLVSIKTRPDIEKIIKISEQFYKEKNTSFGVFINDIFCSSSITKHLALLGYSPTDDSVCMGLDLSSNNFSNPIAFEKPQHLVSHSDDLSQWIMPLIKAFECTQAEGLRYAKAHELALQKGFEFYHYSIYQAAQPIASITLSAYNKMVRIDDVGTLPLFQNKGNATSLLKFALYRAKQLGASYAFLESSKKGLSMYQKLGFNPLFNNTIYSRLPKETTAP